MPDSRFDVAIAGLGAMGSAAAFHLASRGAHVLGVDRFAPPHTLGSTHGDTRIIREAYYEHPLYVPLVRRAYELWLDLERKSGRTLYTRTGGLNAGPENSVLVQGALRTVREHGVAHEVLDAIQIEQRFPAYRPNANWVAVFEQRAGCLAPEACVEAHLMLAATEGATLIRDEPVTEWAADGGGVTLRTAKGQYRVDRLILATGAWLPRMTNGLELPLVVERQISHWFTPTATDDRCAASRCPVAIWETSPGHLFFDLPDVGRGVKCGVHHDGGVTTPETVSRTVTAAENAAARAALASVMPTAAGPLRDARVCLYTNTPDSHFIIDRHPRSPRVLIVSACSGHGFKFSSAIGEILADLATGRESEFDLSPFSLSRFT
jgi:sarcosine oxidase